MNDGKLNKRELMSMERFLAKKCAVLADLDIDAKPMPVLLRRVRELLSILDLNDVQCVMRRHIRRVSDAGIDMKLYVRLLFVVEREIIDASGQL